MKAGMEAWFVLKRPGAAISERAPLSKLLEANKDDEDLCDWLKRAAREGKPGDTFHTGGGAAPRCEVRRVA